MRDILRCNAKDLSKANDLELAKRMQFKAASRTHVAQDREDSQ